ncbi:ATPase P [Dehalobacter sp. DCM]|uniref:HAD family hydrolase n=1 Tax=Dehalobacter sp. DCM TaxID=2907827 RepID=UPI003081B48E|nr:ATPase P [Dehalobacter sp. DCM]
MLSIDIPGWKTLNIRMLVLDYNGTLALDGIISDRTKSYLKQLTADFEIHILTSDTFGTVADQCSNLPVTINRLKSQSHTQEKADYMKYLGGKGIAAIGNGANDRVMVGEADLGIAVIGPEGCSPETQSQADIIVNKIEDAFELLLNPNRIIATLRR